METVNKISLSTCFFFYMRWFIVILDTGLTWQAIEMTFGRGQVHKHYTRSGPLVYDIKFESVRNRMCCRIV